jgi:succinoglycan biosynthesis transport protein ExoP
MFDDNPETPLNWEKYWQIVLRRRWWLILPVAVFWSGTWAVSWFLPSVYRSETLILVEQQKVPEHYVVPNIAADLQERLQSMTQQILSRTRLRRIIDELDLYPGERPRVNPDELVERMRKDIKIELVQTPGKPDELSAFKIYYSGAHARLAQQVTSNLTAFFIDENLRAREQQSEDTTDFLESQLQDARKRLEEQEERLRQFKGQYLGQLPGQLQSNLQILAGLQARLQDANERLGRAEQQKVYLNSMFSQYRSLSMQIRAGAAGGGASRPALDDELDRLKREIAKLRARYTDNYPDVVELKDQITKQEQLRKQIDADLAKSGDTSTSTEEIDLRGSDPKTISPVLEIQSQIKANELEIQNRKREIQDVEKSTEEYKARLNETPIREQQLADLTRDYEQSRTNYESLLAKKNQSELATNLEKRRQGEQFRILDPPSLPQKPYWPNRVLLSLFGLAAGLVFGGVGIAVAESIDDRIHEQKDITALSTQPVLSIIPSLFTSTENRRRLWRTRLEVTTGAALAIFLIGATVFTYYRG